MYELYQLNELLMIYVLGVIPIVPYSKDDLSYNFMLHTLIILYLTSESDSLRLHSFT